MIRQLPETHDVWRYLRESAELICWLRLNKRYAEADEERESIRKHLGLQVRTEGKHVYIGDNYGPLAWTHDA